MRVLICGGGVIGASIAHFLSRRGIEVLVAERLAPAAAASGKSGGFLALDWCDGTPLAPLARRSFALHADLARTIDGDWGYRRLATYGGAAGRRRPNRRRGNDYSLGWLGRDVTVSQRLGSPETTAQVHPRRFTEAMMRAAQAQGARLRAGEVRGLLRPNGGTKVTGIEIDDDTIEGDAVVIAMGPWSILSTQWLPLPGVFGLKGHSLVFETGASVPAEALFLEYDEGNGAVQAPELFPRNDGTTYVCAISSDAPLPINPAEVMPDPGALERLESMCREMSPVLAAAKILARQACYRPVTQDGLPLIGRVPGIEGAYVATGHSVWGILNAPATGEAMAELIVDGAARSVDLRRFDPGRLPPLDPALLRLERRGR
jgi:glycine/D-amino acid oxidase-like deaminating enzyme